MNENRRLTEIMYVDLDEVGREFLKYAPAYAQQEARQAIGKILELQMQGVIRRGLYYIVLVDLVGSTGYTAEFGNEKAAQRIETFVRSSFDALNEADVTNVGLFVKEIGDAVLYIFQHFPDVLRWHVQHTKQLSILGKREEPYLLRMCVHLGEVFLDGVNPLSLAVSQTFKMEKSVEGGAIVLTEPAYFVAWPTLARAYRAFEHYGRVELDGYEEPVELHRLLLHDQDDLERMLLEKVYE